MTRIVVAPDSLKGSLTAVAAAAAIVAGVRRAAPDAQVVEVPMADGGEGTVDVLAAVWGGSRLLIDSLDPLGRPRPAAYVDVGDGRAAVEVASAGGLPLVGDTPDALGADSRGTGILLHHAVAPGAAVMALGGGGSAPPDGATGALTSLGGRFLDRRGRPLPPGGGSLAELDRVDLDGLVGGARRVRWTLLCDVTNPMVGPAGAAASFGPQKGASPADVVRLERGLTRLADALVEAGCARVHELPGAGAAGGMAGGLAAVFGAEPLAGAEVVADAVGLDRAVAGADLVVTAEGRIDAQSGAGKVVGAVARRAGRAGVPVLGLAGSVAPGFDAVTALGLAGVEVLGRGRLSVTESMGRAAELLADAAAWAVARA